MSLIRRQLSVVLGGIFALIAAAGCGEGAPAGQDLIDSYRERVIAAYEDLEQVREEDFDQGVAGGECFLADAEASTEIGRAFTGGEEEFEPTSQFSFGPPEDETTTCTIKPAGEEALDNEDSFGLTAGTTSLDADELHAQALENGAEEIEGEPSGLADETVVAFGNDSVTDYIWVSDGFFVRIGAPGEHFEDEQTGFETLEVAVEAVEGQLAGD